MIETLMAASCSLSIRIETLMVASYPLSITIEKLMVTPCALWIVIETLMLASCPISITIEKVMDTPCALWIVIETLMVASCPISITIEKLMDTPCPISITIEKLMGTPCPLWIVIETLMDASRPIWIAIETLMVASCPLWIATEALSDVSGPFSIVADKLADASCPLSIALVKLFDSSCRRSTAIDNLTDALDAHAIAVERLTNASCPRSSAAHELTTLSGPHWSRSTRFTTLSESLWVAMGNLVVACVPVPIAIDSPAVVTGGPSIVVVSGTGGCMGGLRTRVASTRGSRADLRSTSRVDCNGVQFPRPAVPAAHASACVRCVGNPSHGKDVIVGATMGKRTVFLSSLATSCLVVVSIWASQWWRNLRVAAGSSWGPPRCSTIVGPAAFTFTRDGGMTIAANSAPLVRPAPGGIAYVDSFGEQTELQRIGPDGIRPLRPIRGRIKGLTADPGDVRHLRAVGEYAQIWDSLDDGQTWVNSITKARVEFSAAAVGATAAAVHEGGLLPLSVQGVSFSPRDIDHIAVAAGMLGAFVTHDGGHSWTFPRGFAPLARPGWGLSSSPGRMPISVRPARAPFFRGDEAGRMLRA
jgi:hypothetical protein